MIVIGIRRLGKIRKRVMRNNNVGVQTSPFSSRGHPTSPKKDSVFVMGWPRAFSHGGANTMPNRVPS